MPESPLNMERVMGIDESVGNRFGHLLVRVCAQTMDGLRPTHVSVGSNITAGIER
jgi:hypothetical protein